MASCKWGLSWWAKHAHCDLSSRASAGVLDTTKSLQILNLYDWKPELAIITCSQTNIPSCKRNSLVKTLRNISNDENAHSNPELNLGHVTVGHAYQIRGSLPQKCIQCVWTIAAYTQSGIQLNVL